MCSKNGLKIKKIILGGLGAIMVVLLSFVMISSMGRKIDAANVSSDLCYVGPDGEQICGSSGSSTGTSTSTDAAPVLTIGTPSTGMIAGSGSSTVYYTRASGTVTITFTDDVALSNYSSTSYYRFRWCSTFYPSTSTCSAYGGLSTSWASLNATSGSRTSTSVTGIVSVPTVVGTAYLWIEGDVKDSSGQYMSNSTNMSSVGSSSNATRCFKFII